MQSLPVNASRSGRSYEGDHGAKPNKSTKSLFPTQRFGPSMAVYGSSLWWSMVCCKQGFVAVDSELWSSECL